MEGQPQRREEVAEGGLQRGRNLVLLLLPPLLLLRQEARVEHPGEVVPAGETQEQREEHQGTWEAEEVVAACAEGRRKPRGVQALEEDQGIRW